METLKEIGNKQFNNLQKQHGTRELKDKITSLEQKTANRSLFDTEGLWEWNQIVKETVKHS